MIQIACFQLDVDVALYFDVLYHKPLLPLLTDIMHLQPQTVLPVLKFQAAVLTQTRTTTAPRFIELWNRALGKLIHDPHVRDCYQILVRQDRQDTDYAAIRTIVQANPPQLLPQLRGADFSGASCFDGNYPNYIYFSAGLIEALEAAQPGFF